MKRLLLLAILSFLLFTYANVLQGQSTFISLTASANTSGIQIIGISVDGTTSHITTLPLDIGIVGLREADWMIRYVRDIQLSPYGTQIAFSAIQPSTNAASLNIYSIQSGILIRRDVAQARQVEWSPEGDAILLSNLIELNSPYNTGAVGVYVYDVAANDLHLIATSTGNFGNHLWLPNSQQLVFAGNGIPCQQPCSSREDLYLINRDGSDIQPLTNLGIQLPSALLKSICEPVWSEWNMRIYFRVGCISEQPIPQEYLYSTDLNGAVRQEIAIEEAISGFPNAVVFESILVDNVNESIFTVSSQEGADETGARIETWRIESIDDKPNSEVVYEVNARGLFSFQIQTSALSANGSIVAIASQEYGDSESGLITVISLETGQVIATKSGLRPICNIVWSGTDQLLFTQQSTERLVCPNFGDVGSQAISQFDITTGMITDITQGVTLPLLFVGSSPFISANVQIPTVHSFVPTQAKPSPRLHIRERVGAE